MFKYLVCSCLFISSVNALVDYSDNSSSERFSKRIKPKEKIITRSAPRNTSSKLSTSRRSASPSLTGISFSSSVDTLTIGSYQNYKESKVSKISFSLDVQTPYNIYLSTKYFLASSANQNLANTSDYQAGNAEFILGFNWLKFGGEYDQGLLNIYGGASVGQKNSDFAHSRTNQIYGIETVKRFLSFALGLGYELRISGKSTSESSTGNIGKLYGSVGWEVSNDIKMAVEAATVNIGEGKGNGINSNSINYSYFVPKIQLGLSPRVSLDLVALFVINKSVMSDSISAKLWDQEGIFGNSLSAKLAFSL